MADVIVPLEFSSEEQEIDLKDFSKSLQSDLTDPTTVFNKLLKERMQDTPAAGAEPGDIGVFSGELDKLYKEANNIALDNKLELISETVGEPVVNSDWSNKRDAALLFDLSRSKSFVNRKKKFKKYYPEGEFIRNQVTVGDRTLDLELYKYNKDDSEYRIVDPFGLEYSDFAVMAGHLINAQLAGEGIGLFTGSLVGQPTLGVALGSWLGLKGDKAIEALRGYGEEEFVGGEFDMKQFFLDYDDLFSAAISGGLFKLTSKIGDILFLGKRPGTIELTPQITAAAEKLGLDPLVFAQLAVNPQIRNIFTQAEGFTSYVPNTKQRQIDSIIESFKKGENPFDKLDVEGPLKIDLQDLLNVQTTLANDAKKLMKVNFGIKEGVIDVTQADQALSGIIKNFNKVNKKFQNRYMNNAIKDAQASDDMFINLKGFNQVLVREINDLLSGVTAKSGKAYKQSYKSIKDLPEFKKIFQNIKAIGGGSHVTKDKNMLNFKTLYKIREDLHKLMHDPRSEINLAATAMHKNIVRLLDPKNKLIGGSDNFILNTKILNSQVANAEAVNGMNMIREAFVKGNDLDGFVKTMIKPGNTNNISAIQQMLKLPDDASDADRRVSEKFFNTLKNYWVASIAKSDDGAKILDDFMFYDKSSLKVLLGPDFEQKVPELHKLMELSNKVDNGIVNEALSTKATAKEFTDRIIADAKKGKFGTSNSVDELIDDLGGFDGKMVNDIRNNIMKDLFKRSNKIQDKPGKKQLQEVLDVKAFSDNIKKLREDENLIKFFNGDQLEALTAYEQYSRAGGGNLGVGGELAKAEQTSQLVQKFNILDTGLTILKYDILARLLSRPVTAKLLKDLRPDGLSTTNLKLIQTALVRMEEELFEDVQGKNKFEDQGIINEYKIKPKEVGSAPMAAGAVPQETAAINIPPEINRANQESRLARANPVGMMPTPTGGGIDPNLMARGQINQTTKDRGREVFGPFDPVFASKGGIMSTNKAFQRVA